VGTIFSRGEKLSYDDFEAFGLMLCPGLRRTGAAAGFTILLGLVRAIVLMVALLPSLPVRGAVLPHSGPVPAEAMNGEY